MAASPPKELPPDLDLEVSFAGSSPVAPVTSRRLFQQVSRALGQKLGSLKEKPEQMAA